MLKTSGILSWFVRDQILREALQSFTGFYHDQPSSFNHFNNKNDVHCVLSILNNTRTVVNCYTWQKQTLL